MTSRTIFIVVFAALMAAGHAAARDLHIALQAHEPTSRAIDPRVIANARDVERGDAGGWAFRFADDTTPYTRVSVVIEKDSLPEGYQSGAWAFDLPYFWSRAGKDGFYDLAVAISNDDRTDRTVLNFMDSLPNTVERASIERLAMLNQRARSIFLGRIGYVESGGRPLDHDDVRVAYRLVQTSWELVRLKAFVPDEATRRAADLLSDIAEDDEKARRWLGAQNSNQTVGRPAVRQVVRFLRERESTLLQFIVDQIDADLRTSQHRAEGCGRAAGLKAYLNRYDVATLDRIDPDRRFLVVASRETVICHTRRLNTELRSNSAIRTDLAEARALHDDLIGLVELAEKKGIRAGIATAARARAGEFMIAIEDAENRLARQRPSSEQVSEAPPTPVAQPEARL